MWRRVILPGLLGGVVFVLWMFVVNGLFGFKASLDMKQVPNERQVYELLKENITEPGRYVCNPELTAERRFPEGEPVFGILNGGIGHEAAGRSALIQLVLFFVMPIAATWVLSLARGSVLSSYGRKLCFYTCIGFLIGVSSHMLDFGIGSRPLEDALIHTAHDILLWTFAGLAMAWRVKPGSA